MRFRAFGVRMVFIVGLGAVVLLLQMFAVSQLSSSQSPDKDPLAEKQTEDTQEAPSLHILNKWPLEKQDQNRPPPPQPEAKHDEIDARKAHHDRVVRHMQQLMNNTHDAQKNAGQPQVKQDGDVNVLWRGQAITKTTTTTMTTPSSFQDRENLDGLKPLPVPDAYKNCDIQTKKDAVSAYDRATTPECKQLIRNVTCLQKAGLLYDTNLRRECKTQTSGRNFRSVPLSDYADGPKARVVFLFSLHGRALRQVKRLFKAVYHRDHYYFIHVDSRSDYLHRNLYETFSDYPNIYFPTWRIATIWGGASLLQMLLRALEDLENILTSWKWDYFINISESDYPLKTNSELVTFLKAHNGDNFVKTHGADIKKFIQKQGLDRTFVECDNHMWRVDNRPLPGDITVDGGSDWIAIHRNYSRYLVTDRSRFLTGVKRYYEYSLLPAESFFHTVLRNGPMCDTFVRTNLRVTNWNRKLGCRCQYKHIVDWCGCSPNDFLTKDFGRLQAPGDHNFFARKFEAIVCQDVITRLDNYLYGALPDDTPGLLSYWENMYHVEDDVNYRYNAKFSTYQSFLRQGLASLYIQLKKVAVVDEECEVPRQAVVKEVSVLMASDKFKGLVVTLRDGMATSLSPPEFEVFFTPIDYLQKYESANELAKRVYSFEVGSDWDGKESMFRNYGGILGAWDEPVAVVRVNPGQTGDINLVWSDPTKLQVAMHTVKVESGWFVTFHKPKLERPIRPGVWNVRVELKSGEAIMERKFLVVPLTHENMRPLGNPAAVNAARLNDPHSPSIGAEELDEWKENVQKTGQSLEEWLDELVGDFWMIEQVCRTGAERDDCAHFRDCANMEWSTFSPDPKSEIGEIKQNGRIR